MNSLRLVVLLVSLCLVMSLSSGCGENNSKQIHLVIGTVSISQEKLAEQNYQVNIPVTLKKNGGISYAKWGLSYHSQLSISVNTSYENLIFSSYSSNNEDSRILWTVWESTDGKILDEGIVLYLTVTLPTTAQTGAYYAISYSQTSATGVEHAWYSEVSDWVKLDEVSWVDGGVQIT